MAAEWHSGGDREGGRTEVDGGEQDGRRRAQVRLQGDTRWESSVR